MEMVDLFCGGGGSSSGFHQAGFETKYAIDNKWHTTQTFNANFGNIAHQRDISTLRSEVILQEFKKRPTLVTSSPPCEPFTPTNHKRIKNTYNRLFDDETGRLTLHALRLISNIDPEFWILENVKGMIEGENKQILREQIIDLGLGNPYFNIVHAKDWGVPSNRTRVIISNIKLTTPKMKYLSVNDAIGNLPDPKYPNNLKNHDFIPIPHKYEKDMITQKPGEGLVFFYGAKQDYQNYIRLKSNDTAPVVMGKSRFIHPFFDRLLTVFEQGRLMTFPDDYSYVGSIEQIFDIIGEAIPPKITKEIGLQIIKNQ
ncbi:DNA cytosine methyltransferase [archaeon]|nr:DNA (cytosine-5-)-methyltransferase [Candidatus Heimdallarchaeota archaeon]NDB28879.1 DNA cytosine methyltransferase [archaeon]NDB55199.1 DNA cytosine methyltransferase [archaeon]NDB79036.1 DNA cytosine methyltransferase [archaeon]|tara:strand:+ start:531 stop:1469 length:939 start_codon:yes stop_codon:yes gene_type:complete